ncbi:L,D-transpeptidase family protein [Dyadobacter sp. CY356]|uniref:L,D-transpeptidase family protein n=1 Tax=Dyadobacter sp. CY356 TaxID=2906442 RepID=UPI001F00F101|nr:L,D-transpeptidase family protein [Dyadobacter sp. CY356]MCF0058487.1 L,D-transpeptidase family protein [Dyadobacter sp. CY356]
MRIFSGLSRSKYISFSILIILVALQSCKKDAETMTQQELVKELSKEKKYNELLEYAAGAGVKTEKFAFKESDAPVFALLEETGYGHQPSFRYINKKIKADTTILKEAAIALIKGESVNKVMEKIEPEYPVYKNLKKHYTRLIAENKKDSAAVVAESINAYRWIHRQAGEAPRLVMVNIRGAYLTGMDADGKGGITMRTIAGKIDTQTPTIDTYATSIVTHPYWNVPKSIAIKEIFPKAAKDEEYLSRNKIEVIDKKGEVIDPADIDWESMTPEEFPYRFRQETGGDNSLGLLKVEIKNPLAIYLHDTNARYLFNTDQRWRSHGCVRVQRPTELANFMAGEQLLDNDTLTEQDTISIPPKWHKLKKRIPVFLLYLGADCNEKGDLLYFADVYKRDSPKV